MHLDLVYLDEVFVVFALEFHFVHITNRIIAVFVLCCIGCWLRWQRDNFLFKGLKDEWITFSSHLCLDYFIDEVEVGDLLGSVSLCFENLST